MGLPVGEVTDCVLKQRADDLFGYFPSANFSTSFLINGSPPARSINDTPISSASEKILFQDSFVNCPLSMLSEHSLFSLA